MRSSRATWTRTGTSTLAVANYDSHTIAVLENTAGVFTGQPVIRVGTRPSTLAAGDLDGDRLPDLGVANDDSDNLSIIINAEKDPPPRQRARATGTRTGASTPPTSSNS